jgi:hypothetical protein
VTYCIAGAETVPLRTAAYAMTSVQLALVASPFLHAPACGRYMTRPAGSATGVQGLTLVHFSAHRKRFR